MKKSILLILLLIFLTGSMNTCCFAEDENKVAFIGTVTGSKLHMRQQPDIESPIVKDYNPGAKMEIIENNGTWCYVRNGSTTGYMMTKYLTITSNFKHMTWGKTPEEIQILTIYSRGDIASEPVMRFWSGASVDVLEKSDGFYKIRLNDRIGYIQSESVTLYDGDFESSVFSRSMGIYRAADGINGTLIKNYGEEMTVSGNIGDTGYRFTYPITGNGKADAQISKWMKDLKNAVPEKADGTMTVDYESGIADERFASVRLFAVYSDETGKCETTRSFTVDLNTGSVIDAKEMITDKQRVLLLLESKIAKIIPSASEGYTLKPDDSWLEQIEVTESGFRFNLPEGLFAPISLGNQNVVLTYREMANCIQMEGNLPQFHTIDPSKPMICFTFDDGPSETSERIMDAFLENGGHCTFCVQGQRISNFEATIKRIVAEGNEIASHTYNHKKLTELSNSKIRYQLTETQKVLRQIVDYDIKWLRCPYGSCNKNVRSICKEYGINIAFWLIDTEDWSTQNATSTYNAIMKQAKDGAIILCHDLYPQTAAAIERVLPDLVEKGYQMVTLSEMFSFMEGGPVPGTVYSQLKDEDKVTK